MKKIILASKSIDRGRILHNALISFDFLLTYVNEDKYKEKISDPIELVKTLAKAKAESAKKIMVNEKRDAIIIAADTIVELDGEIIGKAKDIDHAFKILKKMVGRTHNLITGIAITETNHKKIIVDYDTTVVEFINLSDEDIRSYIKSNEWRGRAGAYSIRDIASLFIGSIKGSSSNVIGLPLHKMFQILKDEFDTNLLNVNL
jgi:septum formation protein